MSDPGELIMALYLCVTRFDRQNTFSRILTKNNSFSGHSSDWFTLFTDSNIFKKLQRSQTEKERCDFNLYALEVAVRNDYSFMVEEILDGRAIVSSKMVEILLKEKKLRVLISMITSIQKEI